MNNIFLTTFRPNHNRKTNLFNNRLCWTCINIHLNLNNIHVWGGGGGLKNEPLQFGKKCTNFRRPITNQNQIMMKQKGDDYCGKGHACHINATCLNLNTKYSCTCRSGFRGNGFECTGK